MSTFPHPEGQAPYQHKSFPRKANPNETDPSIYLPAAVSGDKQITPEALENMKKACSSLSFRGFTLRGGGDGPVEELVESTAKYELLLPWRDFNQKQSKTTFTIERATHIAKRFHPTFDLLKKGVQLIQAKNARLIFGDKMMSPAILLLIWTPDGAEKAQEVTTKTGYTGHVIKIACAAGTRVFNYALPDADKRMEEFVNGLNI